MGERAPTVLDAGAFVLASLWMAATGLVAAVPPLPVPTVSSRAA